MKKRFTLEEVEQAILSVLPAFPKRRLRYQLDFIAHIWQLAKAKLEGLNNG